MRAIGAEVGGLGRSRVHHHLLVLRELELGDVADRANGVPRSFVPTAAGEALVDRLQAYATRNGPGGADKGQTGAGKSAAEGGKRRAGR